MNIEDSIKTLKEFNKIKINSYAMQFVNISYPDLQEAIETLLTAYEEKCKELKKEIQDDLDVRNRWGLTLQELEKEKEKNKELEKKLDEISEIHFPIIY